MNDFQRLKNRDRQTDKHRQREDIKHKVMNEFQRLGAVKYWSTPNLPPQPPTPPPSRVWEGPNLRAEKRGVLPLHFTVGYLC